MASSSNDSAAATLDDHLIAERLHSILLLIPPLASYQYRNTKLASAIIEAVPMAVYSMGVASGINVLGCYFKLIDQNEKLIPTDRDALLAMNSAGVVSLLMDATLTYLGASGPEGSNNTDGLWHDTLRTLSFLCILLQCHPELESFAREWVKPASRLVDAVLDHEGVWRFISLERLGDTSSRTLRRQEDLLESLAFLTKPMFRPSKFVSLPGLTDSVVRASAHLVTRIRQHSAARMAPFSNSVFVEIASDVLVHSLRLLCTGTAPSNDVVYLTGYTLADLVHQTKLLILPEAVDRSDNPAAGILTHIEALRTLLSRADAPAEWIFVVAEQRLFSQVAQLTRGYALQIMAHGPQMARGAFVREFPGPGFPSLPVLPLTPILPCLTLLEDIAELVKKHNCFPLLNEIADCDALFVAEMVSFLRDGGIGHLRWVEIFLLLRRHPEATDAFEKAADQFRVISHRWHSGLTSSREVFPTPSAGAAKALDDTKRAYARITGTNPTNRDPAPSDPKAPFDRPVLDNLTVWEVLFGGHALALGLSPSSLPPIVCAAIGCESLDEPTMQCVRCRSANYCNKICQRR